MSFVWVAIGTTVATAAYSADQGRKSRNQAKDALIATQKEDAKRAAEAETSAQTAANARTIEAKRRRSANALTLGDGSQRVAAVMSPSNTPATTSTLGGGSDI